MALAPARSPSSPFGKGSNAQKAGTPDAGPEGPAACSPNQAKREFAAVRSAPGQGRAEAGFIGLFGEKARFAATSAANLKFLHQLPQDRSGTSNSKPH